MATRALRYNTLAPASDDALQQALGTTFAPNPQQCLATHPCPDSSSPEQDEPIGRDFGQEPEATQATLSLQLANPHGVTCFVNADLQAFIWGSLQRPDALWRDFGEIAVQELLLPRSAHVYALGLPARFGDTLIGKLVLLSFCTACLSGLVPPTWICHGHVGCSCLTRSVLVTMEANPGHPL